MHRGGKALKTARWAIIIRRGTIKSRLPISSGSDPPFPGLPEVKRTRNIGSENPGKLAFMRVSGQIER